jgi:hypothetical protein
MILKFVCVYAVIIESVRQVDKRQAFKMCFSESQRKSLTLSGPHSTIRNFQDPNAFAVEKVSVLPKLCNLKYS